MQAKFGIRFILLVLFTVFLFVPLTKVAIAKVNLPDQVKAWLLSV